ncbi:MAG UNVERIFIED_CONTAM: hypothetical protein LVR18_07560 [Planctomycetaceae bacterium]
MNTLIRSLALELSIPRTLVAVYTANCRMLQKFPGNPPENAVLPPPLPAPAPLQPVRIVRTLSSAGICSEKALLRCIPAPISCPSGPPRQPPQET